MKTEAAQSFLKKSMNGKTNEGQISGPSLDQIGVELGIDQSSLVHGYLDTYQYLLDQLARRKPKFSVAIIQAGGNDLHLALQQFYPDAEIQRYRINFEYKDFDQLALLLSKRGKFDVIIEDGTNKKSHKVAILKDAIFALKNNGFYIIEDLHASYIERLCDVPGEGVVDVLNRLLLSKYQGSCRGIEGEFLRFVERVDSCLFRNKLAVLSVGDGVYLYKERHSDTLSVLDEVFPKRVFKARCNIISNGNLLNNKIPHSFDLPSMAIRTYEHVTCYLGRVVCKDGVILNDSFRMKHQWLKNRNLIDCSRNYAKLRSSEVSVKVTVIFSIWIMNFPVTMGTLFQRWFHNYGPGR